MLKKIILFLLVSVNLFCSESVSNMINCNELSAFYKKSAGNYKWFSVKNEGSKVFKGNKDMTISVSGNVIKLMESSPFESRELLYDSSFNLLKKEVKVTRKDSVFDRLVYEAKENKLYMNKYKNGKVIADSKKNIKNVFDGDIVILEYLYSKGRTVFNGDILSPEGKYNMEYKLIDSVDIEKLGSSYSFPEEFKKNIQMKKSYKVYVGGMTGIVSSFYPHKWFYIIEKESGKVIALFGGNPKDEAEFEYKIKI